jgi:Protein of unknown function (DUF2829)
MHTTHRPASSTGILLSFDRALRLLKAEQSVRRQGWPPRQVLKMVGDEIYIHPNERTIDYWEPNQKDILAEDWVVA